MKILIFLLFVVACNCENDFSERPRNFSIELLYFTEIEQDGHVVISPFGVWSLMTGVALGAAGESYKQLQRAFVLPRSKVMLIDGYKNLTGTVLTRNTKGVTLETNNFLFLDRRFTIYEDFKTSLQKDFGASINVLNFGDSSAALQANKLIENTGARVSNVLKSDDFANSRMILTNVITFKGLWTIPFNKTDTKVEPFYNEKHEVAGQVNMMYLKAPVGYSNIPELKGYVLELPYGDERKYSMLILLPYYDISVNEMYKNLAAVSFNEIFRKVEEDISEFGLEEVEVKIPRFQISTNIVLNKPLFSMGVQDIFDPGAADFSRATSEEIFVSAIVHKAEIEVTESGTVATAASTASFSDRIATPTFSANRPFVYFVLEKSTSSVIFGGIYSKPTVF